MVSTFTEKKSHSLSMSTPETSVGRLGPAPYVRLCATDSYVHSATTVHYNSLAILSPLFCCRKISRHTAESDALSWSLLWHIAWQHAEVVDTHVSLRGTGSHAKGLVTLVCNVKYCMAYHRIARVRRRCSLCRLTQLHMSQIRLLYNVQSRR